MRGGSQAAQKFSPPSARRAAALRCVALSKHHVGRPRTRVFFDARPPIDCNRRKLICQGGCDVRFRAEPEREVCFTCVRRDAYAPPMQSLNIAIVVLYLAAMLAFGWWGKSRTRNTSDYLVAGRRLGPLLYPGTMAAVVLGGASTVGGVGLGYRFGISGMWLVVAIGVGVLLLSLLFAPTVQRLRIFTVSQMLTLRYGSSYTRVSGIVMLAYTLMLSATSTGAYATIFVVLFGWDRATSIAVGGAIVLVYSTVGGMWSITLADMAQFIIKTLGIFFLMLPFALESAGGFAGLAARAGHDPVVGAILAIGRHGQACLQAFEVEAAQRLGIVAQHDGAVCGIAGEDVGHLFGRQALD